MYNILNRKVGIVVFYIKETTHLHAKQQMEIWLSIWVYIMKNDGVHYLWFYILVQ